DCPARPDRWKRARKAGKVPRIRPSGVSVRRQLTRCRDRTVTDSEKIRLLCNVLATGLTAPVVRTTLHGIGLHHSLCPAGWPGIERTARVKRWLKLAAGAAALTLATAGCAGSGGTPAASSSGAPTANQP